jgi:hypothetical protein
MKCIQREVEKAARDGKGVVDFGMSTRSEGESVNILEEGFFAGFDTRIREEVDSDVGFVEWACADGLKL